MKNLLFILILVSYNTFSQCNKEETINIEGGDTYVGCLNDRGLQEGFGTYTFSDGSKLYEGNWKDGKYDGKGTLYDSNGGKKSGIFKNDMLNYGTYHFENEEFTSDYTGGFGDNGLPKGDGDLTTTTKEYTEVKKGKFINGDLFNGESITKYNNGLRITEEIEMAEVVSALITTKEYTEVKKGKFINGDLLNGQIITKYNNGLTITEEVEMAEVVSTHRNDRNYYNVDDVEGNSEYTEIILDKKGDPNDGISYDITLKINGIEGNWIFDTGAQSFTIGKRMFDRLKENGMTYKDLNMDVKSIGIGGISDGELIIIDEIVIGDYKIKNVITKVNLDNDYSLLGMWFLIKFKEVEWSMKNNTLRLYK